MVVVVAVRRTGLRPAHAADVSASFAAAAGESHDAEWRERVSSPFLLRPRLPPQRSQPQRMGRRRRCRKLGFPLFLQRRDPLGTEI